MWHAHFPEVVEVGTEPHRRLGVLVQSERARHGHGVPSHPLAVPEGVGVAGLDGLAPLAYHRQIRGLELRQLAVDVHQVDARVEAPEQAVGVVQEGERLLVSAHRLIEERQLARGLRPVQDRVRAHRLLDRRPEPRLGERGSAGLAKHHAEHAIRVGLVAARVELIEQGERGLGVAPRVLIALPDEVHVRVVDQAQPLEVQVARALGDLVALPEVALRFVELLKVRARHAEVVVGDRAAMLVVRRTVGLEGPPIARQRFVEVALDVREDAEILLDPRAQLAALPAQLEGAEEVLAGIDDRVRRQVDPAERVEGLAREHGVPGVARHGVAPAAQLPCLGRFAPAVAQHGEAPQRLGQRRVLARGLRCGDRRLVQRGRLGDAGRALPSPSFVQQVRRGAHRRARTCLHGSGDQRGGHRELTRRWRSWRSGSPSR